MCRMMQRWVAWAEGAVRPTQARFLGNNFGLWHQARVSLPQNPNWITTSPSWAENASAGGSRIISAETPEFRSFCGD